MKIRNLLMLAALALAIGLSAQRSAMVTNNDNEPTDSIPIDTTVVDSVWVDSVVVDDEAKAGKKSRRKKKEEEKKEPTEYEKLVEKGGTVMNGLFVVRHIEDKWYFEVPDSLLGRLLLCVTRFTAVPQNFGEFAGEEVTHSTIYFEERDDKTMLMRCYVLSQLADDGHDIGRTLERSTVDPMVASFKTVGRTTQGDAQLIEVTSLFKQDNNLMGIQSSAKTSLKLGGLSSDRTFIDTMKVFPINIEVQTTRTYSTASGNKTQASRTGSVTLGLNTSIVLLPREPMRKRLWDDRVGYFVNQFTRFSDDQHKTEHESFISRYRLVPKNLKKYQRGELVEPVKQIVYYIDPATPRKWVPYLIQGVNDWNVAFEAAGFKNAIMAKEWPNDPNMSVDDARYSVLRYLPSETENAYGPRIVDPRSGEIIESHICWYHNVMSLLTKWYMVQCGPLDKRARTMKFDDELMGQLIRFVSSHEVGHTLGLRHNMGASFATPVENLRNKAWVEQHGHTSSIMDYARFNWVAQPEDNVGPKGLFPRIGDYDKWAIKWGYQYRPEFADEYAEKDALKRETTNALRGQQRLWFGGEGRGEDPRAQTEDLGDNSVKASEYGIKNLKRVMQNLPAWTHEDNDQYDDLRTMYQAVRDQYGRLLNHVMKNMGARYHNNLPGEEPVVDVPASRQREAVQFFGSQVFDAPEWLYPANIISKTGTDPTLDNNARQELQLGRFMSAAMLNTLYNQATTSTAPYPIDQYLNDLMGVVFRPLTNQSEWKNKARRQLERAYVQNLNKLVNPTAAEKTPVNARNYNSDALLYVIQHLDQVEQYVKAQQAQSASGSLNALHYADLLVQLQLIRDRRTSPLPYGIQELKIKE